MAHLELQAKVTDHYSKRSKTETEIEIRRFCAIFANSRWTHLLIRKFEFDIDLMVVRDVERSSLNLKNLSYANRALWRPTILINGPEGGLVPACKQTQNCGS